MYLKLRNLSETEFADHAGSTGLSLSRFFPVFQGHHDWLHVELKIKSKQEKKTLSSLAHTHEYRYLEHETCSDSGIALHPYHFEFCPHECKTKKTLFPHTTYLICTPGMQPCLTNAQIKVLFMCVDRSPSFLAGMSFAGGRPSPDKRQRKSGRYPRTNLIFGSSSK